MVGMKMHEYIREELLHLFNKKAPLANYFGMSLSFTKEGNAQIHLPYNPNLNHAMGGIHGGVYATMLDNAGWFTVAANLDRLCWVATSELSVRYLQPVKQSSVCSAQSCIRCSTRISVSGRGINTPGQTLNLSPMNSVEPIRYCRGRYAHRALIKPRKSCFCRFVKTGLSKKSSVRERCKICLNNSSASRQPLFIPLALSVADACCNRSKLFSVAIGRALFSCLLQLRILYP